MASSSSSSPLKPKTPKPSSKKKCSHKEGSAKWCYNCSTPAEKLKSAATDSKRSYPHLQERGFLTWEEELEKDFLRRDEEDRQREQQREEEWQRKYNSSGQQKISPYTSASSSGIRSSSSLFPISEIYKNVKAPNVCKGNCKEAFTVRQFGDEIKRQDKEESLFEGYYDSGLDSDADSPRESEIQARIARGEFNPVDI